MIWIIGADGQLGWELSHLLDNEKHRILTTINDCDITSINDLERVIKNNPQISCIVNCAAYTAVDQAEKERALAYKVNVEGTRNVATEAIKFGLNLIHISTDYVFSGDAYRPYTEEDVTNPKSYYGESKLLGEKAVIELFESSDDKISSKSIELSEETRPEAVLVRTSWLYSRVGNNFVKTISNRARDLVPLKVVFDQVGTPTYAEDLAKVVLEIIAQKNWSTIFNNSHKHGQIRGSKRTSLYHYSNEGVASWYDFAKAILELGKIEGEILPITSNEYKTLAERPAYSVLDKSKIKKDFNIKIPYWRESLERCLH